MLILKMGRHLEKKLIEEERKKKAQEVIENVQREIEDQKRHKRAAEVMTQEQLKNERIEGKRVQRELEAEWEKVRNALQQFGRLCAIL